MSTCNKITGYSRDVEIAAVSALDKLAESPALHKKSAREIIEDMSQKIRERLDGGYSYQQIVDVLKDAGLTISAATLRTYLSAATTTTKSRQKAKKKL